MIIKVPKELKEECWEYLQENNMGNRHSANGNKENQLIGLLGEILTKKIFNIEHTFENGFDGGFDFKYNDKTIDVKTMGRNVDMQDNFVHHLIAFQMKYDCDIYIFNSLNKIKNELNICGWLTKKEIKEKSIFLKKGTLRKRNNGTTFQLKTDGYFINNDMLKNIKELL